jgi:carboxyl-terminal processing protease
MLNFASKSERMKKLQVWVPLLFSLVLIGGMMIGSDLRKNIPETRNIFDTRNRSSLQKVVDLVNLYYVDKVNTDTLTDEAIQAMLNQLDPHSVYIPPTHLAEVNEDLQGNYEGIGVEFFIIEDTVHITKVLAGGPSEKAGLQIGDKFLKVEDTAVTGKTINSDKIKSYLRGPGASKVRVTVLRDGKPIDAVITRGTIPLLSVDASYMIDNQTGYIHLNKFSGTTYEEFMRAMEELQQEGMKKLVFDLRGNGGGILGEAVDIADEFLSDKKLIVYTKGDKQDSIPYECRRPGLFETGDVVLLVDENSASASEVVAGALQDWDRAKIVGRRTFGKGLVQEQFDLKDGSALRLTVARYYTPLGRNIQKPYDKGREAYHGDLSNRYLNGEMVNGDTVSNHHSGRAYNTPGGRIVYGGGGIAPDYFIPYDTTRLTSNIYVLFDNNLFSKFIYSYYLQHKDYFRSFKNPRDFATRFTQTADAWNSLLVYASKESVKLESVPVRDRKEVEQRIKTWMARQLWRMEGYYEVTNMDDPAVQKALEVMKK